MVVDVCLKEDMRVAGLRGANWNASDVCFIAFVPRLTNADHHYGSGRLSNADERGTITDWLQCFSQ